MLLVESNDDSRAIYSAILRHVGMDVQAASCADAAVDQARLHAPDVVVLGLTPPSERALRALRIFREEAACAHVPLIALSTIPAAEERELMLSHGIAAYIAKPCTPLALLAEVRRVLEV